MSGAVSRGAKKNKKKNQTNNKPGFLILDNPFLKVNELQIIEKQSTEKVNVRGGRKPCGGLACHQSYTDYLKRNQKALFWVQTSNIPIDSFNPPMA